MSNYASASHSITYNGRDISEGYMGASLTKSGDLQQMDIDLLGNSCISQLADQSGEVTVTYRQGCESLKVIDQWANGVQLVGDSYELPFQGIFTHDDPISGNTFVGWNAVLVSAGDIAWAEVAGTREVRWRITKVLNTSDATSVMSAIKSYLRD